MRTLHLTNTQFDVLCGILQDTVNDIEEDILDAFKVYRKRIQAAESNNNDLYSWGGGDSLDRERVRDIILEKPQFTWS